MRALPPAKTSLSTNLLWIWIPLGILSLLLVILPSVGTILLLGQRLGTVHPWIEPAFYCLLLFIFYILVVRPILFVYSTPHLDLSRLDRMPYAGKRQIASRMLQNTELPSKIRDDLYTAIVTERMLDEHIIKVVHHLDQTAQKKIDEKARIVFISNTIVQNGRLEALTLLSVNIRMVHQLVSHYGFRSSIRSLWNIYTEVFITAFLLENMDEMDLDSALGLVLSSSVTALPGFHLITHSLIQGTTSALFTLRIGSITREILRVGLHGIPRHERRLYANKEAYNRAREVLPTAIIELSHVLIRKMGDTFLNSMASQEVKKPSNVPVAMAVK